MTKLEKTQALVKIMLLQFSSRMDKRELEHLVVGLHPIDFMEVWLEVNPRDCCQFYDLTRCELMVQGVRVIPLLSAPRL
jgi:hypothetical protein